MSDINNSGGTSDMSNVGQQFVMTPLTFPGNDMVDEQSPGVGVDYDMTGSTNPASLTQVIQSAAGQLRPSTVVASTLPQIVTLPNGQVVAAPSAQSNMTMPILLGGAVLLAVILAMSGGGQQTQ